MVPLTNNHKLTQRQKASFLFAHELNIFALIALLLLGGIIGGCGYQVLGGTSSGHSENTPARIFIPQWKNQTNELSLESTIHNSLFDWFTESGQFSLTNSPSLADYILNGEILSIEHLGSSYDSYDRVTALKARLKVSYSLKSVNSGEIVLNQPVFFRQETYSMADDTVNTLSKRKQTLANLADEIAEEIYMRLLIFLVDQRQQKTNCNCSQGTESFCD